MSTLYAIGGQPTYNYNGITSSKSLQNMSEQEFQSLLSQANTLRSRQQQLSTNNTYANNGSSSGTQTSSNFGGDWTQGNSNFGFDQMKQQAKEMAEFQLENAGKQMQQSYNFRDKEANRDFGFQRSMFQMQDNARQQETRSARDAASRLYFGRARGNRRF